MNSDLCRVCLRAGTLRSIFAKLNSDTISTKIMAIANVQIQINDGLPSCICSICLKNLRTCYKFIEVCEDSDLKLRNLLLGANDEDTCSQTIKSEDNTNNPSDYESPIIEITVPPSINKTDADGQNTQNEIPKMVNIEKHKENLKIKHKSRKVQCPTCGRVMSSMFRLKTHLRTHTGEKPFSCPHCSKSFSLQQNLKVHIRVHTGEKPLTCSVCGESFAHTAGLVTHRRKHSGQTPYHCSLCPRSFRTPGHLQYHTRSHTGEKKFECETCDRAFIMKSDLKQHQRVHSGDKPHVCCTCGLRLARASHLKRHMATHGHGKKNDCPDGGKEEQNVCS